MNEDILLFVTAGAVLAVTISFQIIRKARKQVAAQNWPSSEATIQSAGIEPVSMGRGYSDLPCFAFSYVVNDEYYSGRFALCAKGDRADEALRSLTGQKLRILYDPGRPASFFIPDEVIAGCEVYILPE